MIYLFHPYTEIVQHAWRQEWHSKTSITRQQWSHSLLPNGKTQYNKSGHEEPTPAQMKLPKINLYKILLHREIKLKTTAE